MAYLLSRAALVLIAWAITCTLIKKFWPEADPMIFGVAGATWAVFGTAYFAYLRKLKRDIADFERARRFGGARRLPT